VRWEESLPPFRYDPAAPHHSLFVPTAESECCGSLLRACLAGGRPALLVGESGAGKSAVVHRELAVLSAAAAAAADAAAGDAAGDVQAGAGGAAGAPGGDSGGGGVTALIGCSAVTHVATFQGLLQSKLTKRNGRRVFVLWGFE
jgi:hypothetical protein